MSQPPHILIIGAGLIGLASADAAIARGANVTLIERWQGVGQGTSFSNSGMLHPSEAYPWSIAGVTDHLSAEHIHVAGASVFDLAQRSLDMTITQMKELEVFNPKRPQRILVCSDQDMTSNLERYRELSPHIAEPYPSIFERDTLAVSGYFGNAYQFCSVLAHHVQSRGAHMVLGACDVALDMDGQGLSYRKNGDMKYISADHIIIAAGPQSAALLRPLGYDLPVIAVPGYAMDFAKPDMHLPNCPVMHVDTHSTLSVFEDRLRLSGTVGQDTPDILLRIWQTIAPQVAAHLKSPLSTWRGERPMSRLGRPIIGPGPLPGLWVNTGHGHMGWTLAMASGALIADIILAGHHDPRFAMNWD